MDNLEYRAHPAHNWSAVKHALVSSLAYQHAKANPPAQSAAMRFGTDVHTLVLEPEQFAPVVVPAECLTKSGSRSTAKEAAAWFAANPGALTEAEVADVRACAGAVLAHPLAAAELAACNLREVPLFWTDPDTGLECKGKPDAFGGGVLLDLKTYGGQWTPDLLVREVYSRLYHAQLAFYADGLAANGLTVEAVRLVVVQSSAPWDVAVVEIPHEDLVAGQRTYKKALAVVAEYEAFGAVGAFPAKIVATMPKWLEV